VDNLKRPKKPNNQGGTMPRQKSVKTGGGDFLSKDTFRSLCVDLDKGAKEFAERYKTVQDFEKQLDEAMRVTNEDLKKEFQI
jgi:hypothetical protein